MGALLERCIVWRFVGLAAYTIGKSSCRRSLAKSRALLRILTGRPIWAFTVSGDAAHQKDISLWKMVLVVVLDVFLTILMFVVGFSILRVSRRGDFGNNELRNSNRRVDLADYQTVQPTFIYALARTLR